MTFKQIIIGEIVVFFILNLFFRYTKIGKRIVLLPSELKGRRKHRITLRKQLVEHCIRDYTSQPAGYAMDFGVTDKGETVLIEVNDGFAVASYGLFHIDYAKFLSARWAELTGTEDELNF